MPSHFDRLRIILVEPAGARNVGSIARIMKNMGLRRLVLVNPQCDHWGDEARHMAVHAVDVLEAAQRVNSLLEALQGCRKAIATCGRETTLAMPIEAPRAALPWLLEDTPPVESALIFGREDRGLTNAELNLAQRLLQIPTSPDYSSLNLAQAAAICCYELHTLSLSLPPSTHTPHPTPHTLPLPSTPHTPHPTPHTLPTTQSPIPNPQSPIPPAPLNQLEGFYTHLETLLLKIGYLYPHTASSRMEKFRRLLNRSLPLKEEVALLRGVLRQVEWALQPEKLGRSNDSSSDLLDQLPENLREIDDSHQD